MTETEQDAPEVKRQTLEDAKTAAKALVDKYGYYFVYNPNGEDRCTYAPQPYPYAAGHQLNNAYDEAEWSRRPKAKVGCMVGEILKAWGYPTENLRGASFEVVTVIEGNALPADRVPVTKECSDFLTNLQVAQDAGHHWGLCLEYASALVEDRNVNLPEPPHFGRLRRSPVLDSFA